MEQDIVKDDISKEDTKEYEAVGIMFRKAGRIYDYLCDGFDIKKDDFVVIASDKGEDIAKICIGPRVISVPESQEMRSILRIANEKDLQAKEKNEKDEEKALEVCKKMVVESGLDMKLLSAEYCLDRSKITFYFSSAGRVDFRQLVRDLARVFKTRIELRQIGVRDATKMVGGFGVCGRELCCTKFLRKFDNISIKMAKTNNIIANPNKISGVCGRLMCCLMFEKDGCDCENCYCHDNTEYIKLDDSILDTLIDDEIQDNENEWK